MGRSACLDRRFRTRGASPDVGALAGMPADWALPSVEDESADDEDVGPLRHDGPGIVAKGTVPESTVADTATVALSIHTMRVSSALTPATSCRPATYSSGPLIARSDARTRGGVSRPPAGAAMVSRQGAVPGWWQRQLRFGVGVDVAVGVRDVAFSAEPLLTAGVGVGVGSVAAVAFPAVALPDAAAVRGTGGEPVAGLHREETARPRAHSGERRIHDRRGLKRCPWRSARRARPRPNASRGCTSRARRSTPGRRRTCARAVERRRNCTWVTRIKNVVARRRMFCSGVITTMRATRCRAGAVNNLSGRQVRHRHL
jgi:hypothetical protein